MLRSSSVALCLGVAFLSVPAFADDPSPAPSPAPAPAAAPEKGGGKDDDSKKLLEELEAENKNAPPPKPEIPDLSKVNLAAGLPGTSSMNPDISVILDVAGAGFGVIRPSKKDSPLSDAPLMTGGHDPTTNGFTLRQVELSFSANADPFFRFDSNLVIKDTLEVEEAYATTLDLPFSLQARVGEFLSKFGRQNEQHPHQWWFVSQPLVYGQLMGEDDFRGLGTEVSWLTPLPWPVTLIVAAQDAQGACCARTFSPIPDTPAPVHSPFDLVYTGVIEQFFPVGDDLGVLWGLNAMTGPTDYLDDQTVPGLRGPAHWRGEIWGTDLNIRYKPTNAASRWFVEFQTEAMLRTRHPDTVAPWSAPLVDGGAYAQLIYHPSAEYGTGVRWDYVDGLPGEKAGAGLGPSTNRFALVGELDPTHFSRIQVEVNGGTRGQGDILFGAMVNLEIAIGAHGAHAY